LRKAGRASGSIIIRAAGIRKLKKPTFR